MTPTAKLIEPPPELTAPGIYRIDAVPMSYMISVLKKEKGWTLIGPAGNSA